MAWGVMELTEGLATLLAMPAKLGMLAKELTMLSKLATPDLVTDTGVEAEFNGLATVPAGSAKLGM